MLRKEPIKTIVFLAALLLAIGILFGGCATTQGIERRQQKREARHKAAIARIQADTLTQPAPAWVYPYIYPQRTWGIGPFYNSFYGYYQRPLVIRRKPKNRRHNTRPRVAPTRNRNIVPKPKPRTRPRTGQTRSVITRTNRGRGTAGGKRNEQ